MGFFGFHDSTIPLFQQDALLREFLDGFKAQLAQELFQQTLNFLLGLFGALQMCHPCRDAPARHDA